MSSPREPDSAEHTIAAATIPQAISFDEVIPMDAGRDWTAPLSFAIPEGSFFALRTAPARSAPLVRLCAGLLAPRSGRVTVLGMEPWALGRADTQRLRAWLGVALLPHGLISNQTLRMNIIVPLVYAGLTPVDEASTRADQVLSECGITAWADTRPADVPIDVRQRAVIARAVARSPRLLILQDPLYSIHDQESAALLAVCRRYARTALIVTHRADATLYDFSDAIGIWDDRGFRPHRPRRSTPKTPPVARP